MFDKVLKYRGNTAYVYIEIEKCDDGGVYGFLFLSRATNRGSNSWKFNKLNARTLARLPITDRVG